MPVTIFRVADLPVRLATHIQLEIDGGVTFIAGGRFATFDGDEVLDRNVRYRLEEPIPLCVVDGVELLEAERGGILYVASAARGLILNAGGLTILGTYARHTYEGPVWKVFSRCPLAVAMAILLSQEP